MKEKSIKLKKETKEVLPEEVVAILEEVSKSDKGYVESPEGVTPEDRNYLPRHWSMEVIKGAVLKAYEMGKISHMGSEDIAKNQAMKDMGMEFMDMDTFPQID